jgi:hypothetical protein
MKVEMGSFKLEMATTSVAKTEMLTRAVMERWGIVARTAAATLVTASLSAASASLLTL